MYGVLSNRYPAHSITGQSATEWTSAKNGIIYCGVLLLRVVFPPAPRNQPIRWQPGCTRAETRSLNTRQNFARAHIIELICACATVSIRRAIWSVWETLGLPCCWCGWLLLSCEWTLELLLNDKNNKPSVYNSKEKFLKQNVSATSPRSRICSPVPNLEDTLGACWPQFNLCRQEFAKQVSWLLESHKS